MKRIIVVLSLLCIVLPASARKYEVPKDYVLRGKESYVKYEKDIKKGIDWLVKTPANKEPDKRKAAKTFIHKWIMGCPYVTVGINPEIVTFWQSSPDLFSIYQCGVIRQVLRSGKNDDLAASTLAGIETTIKYYEKNKKITGPNEKMEKLVGMQRDRTLEAFIREKQPKK